MYGGEALTSSLMNVSSVIVAPGESFRMKTETETSYIVNPKSEMIEAELMIYVSAYCDGMK